MPDPHVPKPWQKPARAYTPGPLIDSSCEWCGVAYQTRRRKKNFCSEAHRRLHYDAYHPRIYSEVHGQKIHATWLEKERRARERAAAPPKRGRPRKVDS